MKLSFIILGILGILVAIFFINGCSYPTSYRAFIPKSLDSEYKEFEIKITRLRCERKAR